MIRRALLLLSGFMVFASGCATADDAGVTGKVDSGKISSDTASDDSAASSDSSSTTDTGATATDSAAADSTAADSTAPDTTEADTTEPDTTVPVTDSTSIDSTPELDAEVDTGSVTDTGPAIDAGPLSVLVYDDYPEVPSHAPAAVAALGGTTILCDDTTGTTTWDAGGFDLVIVEASNVSLTTGLDSRLVTWMTGGGRLIFSHWKLDTTTALTTELGVTVSSYSTAKPIYKDASTVDFFAGTKESFTSPISGPGVSFGVHGFTLSVTSPSFLAGRADSASGAGAIAVTHGGKVIVNGFLSADFAEIDADADGKKDLQELLTNELAYVLTK
jgi:hypothetical protein